MHSHQVCPYESLKSDVATAAYFNLARISHHFQASDRMLLAKLSVAPPHRIFFRYVCGGDASIFVKIILSVRDRQRAFALAYSAVRVAPNV